MLLRCHVESREKKSENCPPPFLPGCGEFIFVPWVDACVERRVAIGHAAFEWPDRRRRFDWNKRPDHILLAVETGHTYLWPRFSHTCMLRERKNGFILYLCWLAAGWCAPLGFRVWWKMRENDQIQGCAFEKNQQEGWLCSLSHACPRPRVEEVVRENWVFLFCLLVKYFVTLDYCGQRCDEWARVNWLIAFC